MKSTRQVYWNKNSQSLYWENCFISMETWFNYFEFVNAAPIHKPTQSMIHFAYYITMLYYTKLIKIKTKTMKKSKIFDLEV